MDYSSVPKEDFLYPDKPAQRDLDTRGVSSRNHGSKKHKCCCCKCTTKRFLTICCLATFGPIIILGLIIGIYLLVQRLSYNPPATIESSANDTLAFLEELAMSEKQNNNATVYSSSAYLSISSNSTMNSSISGPSIVVPQGGFLTKVRPPWNNCGSDLATPRVVSIEECVLEDSRCVFVTEIDWMLEVAFSMKPNVVVEAPTFSACGKAIYLGTPCRHQPFSRPNPCNDSNIECPLKGSTNYLYRNIGGIHQKDLPVKILFDTYADVYFRMKDPTTNKQVFCIRIPAIIKPAK